ncbi:MAG TPA: bifunctional 2-polyprenyl-6-hydroxyphenol methylase/3-demethylubiquinol 3-O-methyltransferase UbiG [Planctomycetota bacterium]|nr:bifunctional 2-polyprenyl-6-hydroxyphenol methylase/3-demethylubiquinol 3-O-methyltransferase UbiG [Planctomycetota bacterium]
MARLRNDLGIYERHADDWWNADSAFAGSLHGVNALAIAQVRAQLGARIRGAAIVDLACGGGLVCEPLARDGARVVGIDLGARTLRAAAAHGAGVAALSYVLADAAAPPLDGGWADLVVCADALEHIPRWHGLIEHAARLLKPGGLFYALTLNRTWLARWVAVHLAEGIGIVPRGTHDPALFIRPDELDAAAAGAGLRCQRHIGQRLRLWRTLKRWRVAMDEGRNMAITYSAWYVKARGGGP